MKESPIRLSLLLVLVAAGCGSAAPPAAGDETAAACDKLPPLPWSFRLLAGPPRSEDFTFDNDGYFLALSNNNLVRLANGGAPALVAAQVAIQGTGVRVLPNGDIAVADEVMGAVVRVTAAGDKVKLTDMYVRGPNGLQFGPGGQLFLTDLSGGNLYRIDPTSGATTLLSYVVDDADGLAFSPDYKALFVGSYGLGEVHRLAINADGSVGPPMKIAEGLQGTDGITSDECGNLYLANYDHGTLKRMSPDGKIELVADFGVRSVSAVNFGSGRQGWAARAIYVMNYQDGGVFEVPTAVRGAPPPGRAP